MLPHPRILKTAWLYQLDAHRSNPANLIAASVGMFVNNIIFLVGMWGLLFAGKPQNDGVRPYFFALTFVVMLSWGSLNFLLCGYRLLGDLITDGELEPLLATPRAPLGLIAVSRSSPFALGDVIMGLMGIIWLGWAFGPDIGLRASAAALISMIGFAALFIGAGSLAFFIPRGSNVAQFIIEAMLSLSVYPSGKIFSDWGRMIVLLTPAAATGVLPLDFVENGTVWNFGLALGVAFLFLALALAFFQSGLKRYQTISLISARQH
jgi:ABC-type uncharacterized transport system permease subunit